MNKGSAKAKQVGCAEMLEEMLAMIQVCFEGQVALQGESLQLTLPSGEAFSIAVSRVS